MRILAFKPGDRATFRREMAREAEQGLVEILDRVQRSLARVRVGSGDPESEIEKLGSALLFESREVGLLLSDLAEMQTLERGWRS